MRVAGIDGTSSGWVAVVLQGGKVAEVRPFADFASAIEGLRDTRFIAIDIPIGLPGTGPRQADVLARKRLGARGSSVFTVPRSSPARNGGTPWDPEIDHAHNRLASPYAYDAVGNLVGEG
ncbi:MAG: DUF429 domain-containing protein, partial [Acidobacteria bacterium]